MDGIFIKFGKEEHLRSLVNGNIRFAPSKLYIKIEKEQHNIGQGDMFEGKWVIHAENAKYHKDGRAYYSPCKQQIAIDVQNVTNMPVFCLSYYNEDYLDGRSFQLPDLKLQTIEHDFSEATHALIISDPDSFVSAIQVAEGHKIVSDHIHYYDYSINDIRMMSFLTTGDEKKYKNQKIRFEMSYANRYRHLLCKDIAFRDQEEYRFIVLDELIECPKFYKYDFNSKYQIVPIDRLKQPLEV